MLEVKWKSLGLMALARDISWQPSTDAVLSDCSYVDLYKKKKQMGQTEIENVQFGEKKSTRKCNVGAKSCAQVDKV